MPLITACPACHTQFVVKKEQLKAYEGQVRCGTCQHVFNAKTYLIKSARPKKVTVTQVEVVLSDISLTEDALLDDAATVDTEIADTDTQNEQNFGEVHANQESANEENSSIENLGEAASNQVSVSEAGPVTESSEPITAELVTTENSLAETNAEFTTIGLEDSEQGASDESAPQAQTAAFTQITSTAELSESTPGIETTTETNEAPAIITSTANVTATPIVVDGVSTQDKFHQHLSKRHFSWPIFVLCIVLFITLLSQMLYFMRTEISAHFPHTKPWLSAACAKLGCTVTLPKNIEYLTIDDSDMHEHLEYKEVLVFASTLINHAPYAQAYPTIELTLTNTNDEPVLRRTLTAKDYLPKGVPAEQGIGANSDVYIKLNLNTADIAVAGYRVALNY